MPTIASAWSKDTTKGDIILYPLAPQFMIVDCTNGAFLIEGPNGRRMVIEDYETICPYQGETNYLNGTDSNIFQRPIDKD